MPSSSLIVPVVVPTGSLHFATIQPDGTVQDVIGALLAQPEVISEILGDLDDSGWALQEIRVEKNGRQWEEKDLEKLGDGTPRHLFSWTDGRPFDGLTHSRRIEPRDACFPLAQFVRRYQRHPS